MSDIILSVYWMNALTSEFSILIFLIKYYAIRYTALKKWIYKVIRDGIYLLRIAFEVDEAHVEVNKSEI